MNNISIVLENFSGYRSIAQGTPPHDGNVSLAVRRWKPFFLSRPNRTAGKVRTVRAQRVCATARLSCSDEREARFAGQVIGLPFRWFVSLGKQRNEQANTTRTMAEFQW